MGIWKDNFKGIAKGFGRDFIGGFSAVARGVPKKPIAKADFSGRAGLRDAWKKAHENKKAAPPNIGTSFWDKAKKRVLTRPEIERLTEQDLAKSGLMREFMKRDPKQSNETRQQYMRRIVDSMIGKKGEPLARGQNPFGTFIQPGNQISLRRKEVVRRMNEARSRGNIKDEYKWKTVLRELDSLAGINKN